MPRTRRCELHQWVVVGLREIERAITGVHRHVIHIDEHPLLHHRSEEVLPPGAEPADVRVSVAAQAPVVGEAPAVERDQVRGLGPATGEELHSVELRGGARGVDLQPLVLTGHRGRVDVVQVVGREREAVVEHGAAAERVVREVHRRDHPDALAKERVDPRQRAGLVVVGGAPSLAAEDAVDLDAQQHRELARADREAGLGGRGDQRHPAGVGADHRLDAVDLPLHRGAIAHVGAGPAEERAELLVVHRGRHHQAQSALVSPSDPVDVHLLMDLGLVVGPALEGGIPIVARVRVIQELRQDRARAEDAVRVGAAGQRLIERPGRLAEDQRAVPHLAAEGEVGHGMTVQIGVAPEVGHADGEYALALGREKPSTSPGQIP